MGNNSMYEISIRKNIFLCYPTVLNNMENISLLEGHVPIENYVNQEFRELSNIVKGTEILKGDELSPSNRSGSLPRTYDNRWVVVYRILDGGEEGVKVYSKALGSTYEDDGNTAHNENRFTSYNQVLPFKVFASPLIPRVGASSITMDQEGNKITTITGDLLKHYQQEIADGQTIGIKIVNFEFSPEYVDFVAFDPDGSETGYI
ncbi:MAG: hypothetical protein ACK5MR_12675 [Cumulibacter sp.]